MPPDSVIRPVARIVPSNACPRARWRNGLGWTREIARGRLDSADDAGADDDAWDWRLSIAEIDGEAAFSRFEGVDREQMLLSGNGLRLRRAAGETVLHPPHDRLRFAGEDEVVGCPLDGRVEVVNLMWRRGRVEATSWHRPLVGPMVIFADPGSTWLLHLVAGQGVFADDSGLGRLEAGETAVLTAGPARMRHVFEGGGEVWMIRLRRPGAAG